MNAFLRTLSIAALVFAGGLASAQEPVSTGIIVGLQPNEGTITIRSDQTNGMITFFGADKANIFTSDGNPFILQNLKPGTKVTVQYATKGEKWYVSKIILPVGTMPPGAMPPQGVPATSGPATAPANQVQQRSQVMPVEQGPLTPAATDGDITTRPGADNSRSDRDITTNPGTINTNVKAAPVRRGR